MAKLILAEVAAHGAPANADRRLFERRNQLLKLAGLPQEQLKRNSFGGTVPHPWKFPQGQLQFFKGARHSLRTHPAPEMQM